MKRLIFGILILVGLLIVAAVTVPFLVPKDVYKAQIQSATSKALDREIVLDGDVSLSVFPQISVGVDGLIIANEAGFDGDYLLKAGELRAAVKLLPLLSRRVEVSTLSFVDADVNLVRNADGQVNWELGGSAEEEPTSETSGPSDFQAGIDRARLVNASLQYRDFIEDVSYSIENMTAEASMKGLDAPLDAKIDGVFDGRAFSGQVSIEKPNGLLASEPSALDGRFEIANVTVRYDGAITLGETPDMKGRFELSADRLSELSDLLQTEIAGADLIGRLVMSGELDGSPDSMAFSSLDVKHSDGAFDASYRGAGSLIGEQITFDGLFKFETDSISDITQSLALEIDGSDLLDRISLEGQVKGTVSDAAQDISLSNLKASHKGSNFDADYQGEVRLAGETATLDGQTSFKSAQILRLTQALGLEVEGAELIESVDLSATVSGSTSGDTMNLSLTGIDARHRGSAFNARYRGDSQLIGETTRLNGGFEFDTDDLGTLASAMSIEIDGAEALGRVDVTGRANGALDALSLTGVDFSQQSSLLTSSFKGDASTVGAGSVSGQVSASSTNLRALMAAANVQLTPGETLQSFNVAGTASGTLEQIQIALSTARLDDMTAAGTIGIDLRGARPIVDVDAETNTLDLTPFTKPDPNAPTPEGWSKVPLPLDSLAMVDANFDLAVDRLIIDKVVLNQATVNGTLRNGDLKANMPGFQTFGGAWTGDFTLSTSGSTPTISMDFNGNAIQVENLVSTFTGIDRIAGEGLFRFQGRMNGTSLYDFANSLDGGLSMNMGNGIIRGFNASQLMRSRESILASLTSGNFNLPIGPSAETDFTRLSSVLSINNGVGRFDALEVLNPFVSINGLGTIDFGAQALDISLKFAADTTGQRQNQSTLGIGGIGIPLNIRGNWLKPSIGPDASALQSLVTATVIDRVVPGLGNATGQGGAPDPTAILRGVLGDQLAIPGAPQPQTPTPSDPNQPTPAEGEKKKDDPKPETPEEVVEDIARQALTDLFGRRRQPEKKDDDGN